MVSPSQKRRAARFFFLAKRCSLSFVCRAFSLAKSSYYYTPKFSLFESELIKSLRFLGRRFPRYGYRRMTVMLHSEGWRVNRKRIQRLMRLDGLKITAKPKKRKRLGVSTSERQKAVRAGHVWSWDFVFDRSEDGRQLKILGILDEYTRECLCLKAARYFTGVDVIGELSALIEERGIPEHIRSDNGPEFIAIAVKNWVESRRVGAIYINPGSPWENAYIESFFSRFRDECLERELFGSLQEARVVIEDWRKEYNELRPHSALGYAPPSVFSMHPKAPIARLSSPSGVAV
jgi:transposase InsO family protein